MRGRMRIVLLAGLLVGSSPGYAQESAGANTRPDRQTCARLARTKKAMEKRGVRELLEQPPGVVLSQRGPDGQRRVYEYIKLRETVLFRCPPFVLNANLDPIETRDGAKPPLPIKGPKRTAAQRRIKPIVPLPVRAPLGQWPKKRFKVPQSQG